MKKQLNIVNAKRDGLRIVEPKPNELQIDLDSARAIHIYGRQFMLLKHEGVTKGWRERMTKSKGGGNHVHIVITMPRSIDNFKRVLLQAILGSDLKRECFNFCRVLKGTKYPIVLFEREGATRVRAWKSKRNV